MCIARVRCRVDRGSRWTRQRCRWRTSHPRPARSTRRQSRTSRASSAQSRCVGSTVMMSLDGSTCSPTAASSPDAGFRFVAMCFGLQWPTRSGGVWSHVADRREPGRCQPRRRVRRGEERAVAATRPAVDRDGSCADPAPGRASRRAPRRWPRLGGQRPDHLDAPRSTRPPPHVGPLAGCARVERRHSSPHVARSAAYRGDAHGQQRQRHRRAPLDR